jgi:TPR repeat protein
LSYIQAKKLNKAMNDLSKQIKLPWKKFSMSQQPAIGKIIHAYKRKADKGSAIAQLSFACMYGLGRGVTRDCKEAFG